MSLDKTLKHSYRLPTDLEKYAVYDALPLHFETQYPKLISFMEKYYDFADTPEGFGGKLQDLEVKRDLVEASDEVLRFFSEELLLGRSYFDRFVDKRTAVAVSNLLYRSKGTKYSIQQFFRVFFGFDVQVRYGRDEVFLVGDPREELLIYKSEYKSGYMYPGRRLRFQFDDGDMQVYSLRKDPEEVVTFGDYAEARYVLDAEDYVEEFTREFFYDKWSQLRQDIDYTVDYADKSVVLQEIPEGYDPVNPDAWIADLAQYGIMREEGQQVKIEIKRPDPASSPIGPDVSEKRITNNGFWQMFSLLISSPISVNSWREAYKDFVHPAGMYLEGQVVIESVANMSIGKQENAITDQYRVLVESTVEMQNFVYTMMTELNLRSGIDSEEVYRSRINDVRHLDFTLEELDAQYDSDKGMARIDDIAPRTFVETTIDMSNTINTLDENVWHADNIINSCDSDEYVLGEFLDYPPESPGCAPDKQVYTRTAYRDGRIWDDYVSDDYSTEISSYDPASAWKGNQDYVNSFARAKVEGSASRFTTYVMHDFVEDDYSELVLMTSSNKSKSTNSYK